MRLLLIYFCITYSLLNMATVKASEAKLEKTRLQFSNLDERYIQFIFDHHKNEWLKDFNKEELIKKLKTIVSSEKSQITFSDEEFVKLRKDRNKTVFIRENFYIFDKTHKPSEIFEEFVVQYGKLKDAYHVEKKKALRKNAKKLLDILEKIDINAELAKFRPAKPSEVIANLEKNYEELLKLIVKDKVPLDDFHHARKIARRMTSFAEMIEWQFPDEDIQHIRNKLDKINKYLDGRHDHYTQLRFLKEIDYNETFIDINPKDRDKFQKLEKHYNRLLEFVKTPKIMNGTCLRFVLESITK